MMSFERRGGAAEPPSSTSEARGRQEDVSQLTFLARARGLLREGLTGRRAGSAEGRSSPRA